MIWIGDDILVEIVGNNPHRTLIKYKDELVGGIQEFVCNITVEKIECRCTLYPFDYLTNQGADVVKAEATQTQKLFAAELVRQGFDIIWANMFKQEETLEFKANDTLTSENINQILTQGPKHTICNGFRPSEHITRFV